MKKLAVYRSVVWIFVLLSAESVARAQFSPDSSAGLGAGLVKLFGNINGFSAKADVQALNTNRQETMRTPMNFALLDGKMRMDCDISEVRGKSVDPRAVAAYKQAGLDRVTSITRLDKRTIYIAFAGARSYVDVKMSQADAEAAEKNVQVQRIVLGKETVDNHPCTKTKVIVKSAKGAPVFDAITWNAADMKEFPVQIMIQAKEGTTVMRFSQVQMKRPAAALFEPPAGYAHYGSPEALFLAIAQKQTVSAKSGATTKPGVAPKTVAPQKAVVAPRKPGVAPGTTNNSAKPNAATPPAAGRK